MKLFTDFQRPLCPRDHSQLTFCSFSCRVKGGAVICLLKSSGRRRRTDDPSESLNSCTKLYVAVWGVERRSSRYNLSLQQQQKSFAQKCPVEQHFDPSQHQQGEGRTSQSLLQMRLRLASAFASHPCGSRTFVVINSTHSPIFDRAKMEERRGREGGGAIVKRPCGSDR